MGNVMIKCPKTGDAIFTGLTADKASFAVTPVFFGVAFCSACGGTHDWFARDAWVQECSAGSRARLSIRAEAGAPRRTPRLRAVAQSGRW